MNIGLIGCGQVANLHAEIYQLIGDIKVVASADPDFNKAKILSQKYGIPKTFSDYLELLEDKDIGFVDICTPTSTHTEIACNSAKSGHNILLEKPMAGTIKECNRIIHESRKNGIKLCLVHNLLFFPTVQLLKQMVNTENYELTSLRTSYKVWKEKNQFPKWIFTPGNKGILWELGYHLAYLQLEFLKDIENIHAYARKIENPIYDRIGALLSTPSLNYGILEISAISRQREFLLEMDVTDGKRVKIDLDNDTFTEMPTLQRSGLKKFFSQAKKLCKVAFSKRRETELGYSVGHFQLICEFLKSLKFDTLPPVMPEQGKAVIRLLSRIEEQIAKNSNI